MQMKWLFPVFGILSAVLFLSPVYGIAVQVGPMYYDREGGDTEMRLGGISVSTARWSLKDGKVEENETAVSLMVLRPQPDIIGINIEKSEIKVFCDDKGTNFIEGRDNASGAAGVIETTPPSSYSQSLGFKVRAPKLPHPRASKLRIEGTVVIVKGINRITVENRDVPLKEESEINAGPYMLKITKVGAPDAKKFPWVQDRDAIAITIEGENEKRVIRDMQFMDSEGNHAGVSMVSATFGDDKSKNIYEYIVMNRLDRLTVKVSYWSGMEDISLPFKFETGLDAEAKDIK